MDKCEIVERLKKIAEHSVHTVGEEPFVMSLDDGIAVHEAIELLKKPETNCSEIPNNSDTISRQQAIDALRKMQTYKLFAGDDLLLINQAEAQTELMMLPSAQPYTIHSDGRLWVTVDDIDKVNAVVVDESKSKFCKQFYMDVQPKPKRGKWILDRSGAYCCDKCMEPCATYMMMKPRDRYCKMCGSRNEVME